MGDPADRIERLLGRRPRRLVPLAGGCIAEVLRADLDGGERVVVKCSRDRRPDLSIEAWMLRELRRRSDLPVPTVLAATADLLVLEYVEHDDRPPGCEAQRHAAELLAALHRISAPAYGLERDTLIGPLPQPNDRSARWLPFFRERRLLHMARTARRSGRLPPAVFARLERLASRLEEWLVEPSRPALLHGDVWSGNLLVRGRRVAAFLDPAIYFGDPEIELAFTTLFGPFERPFYERYAEIAGIAPGFFELRKDIYNLYPLLVHLQLFGGGYLRPITALLDRLGL